MFTAASYNENSEHWKQPKCPPTRDQKQKMCHSHKMEYNAATKCKSQLCVAIGVNLTDVTSEDANQAKRQRWCGLIYVKLKVRETHVQ